MPSRARRRDATSGPRVASDPLERAGERVDVGSRGRRANGSAGERFASVAIALFALLRFVMRWYAATKLTHVTTDASMPLVRRTEDYLSFAEFAALKECALRHPKLRVRGGLNDVGFSKTRGFVVKFNLEGVERFRSDPEYACFAPVFDRLRLPDANAFVMNILLCQLGDYDAYNANELSVGLHLDTSVGIYSRHMYVAHQVSVLYNNVPPDMEGGELELYEYGPGQPDLNHPPGDKIVPKENMLITFRGDAFHQVRSYRTKSGAERVSLVLEQYKINDASYGKTIRYTEAFKSNMTMM